VSAAPAGGKNPPRSGFEADVPHRHVAVRSGGPRARRRARRNEPGEWARHDRHLGDLAAVVDGAVPGHLVVPEHREVWGHELVVARQVEPDLEELERVGLVPVEQGEHLGVDDALPGGHPLDVTAAVAGGRAQGVGVVHEPTTHERDGLEAAVWVLREAGDRAPVVHPPAVDAREVHPEVAAVERRARPGHGVARRVDVEVVHAEQERVDGLPWRAEPDRLEECGAHRAQATKMPAGSWR
jgi:hypothetical protein